MSPVCALCGQGEVPSTSIEGVVGVGELLGPFGDAGSERRRGGGLYVHRQCALWSPEVYVDEDGKWRNVAAAVRRGRGLKCARCGEYGATLGCIYDKCPKSYHIPCAQQEGCCFRVEKFAMACPAHRTLLPPPEVLNACPLVDLDEEERGLPQDGRRKIIRGRELQKHSRQQTKRRRTQELQRRWIAKGRDSEDEFQRKNARSLMKDQMRIMPVFVGGDEEQQALQMKQGKLQQFVLAENWNRVAGVSPAVIALHETVLLPLLYPDTFKKMGVEAPRGVLLHGPPGTGKTLSVRSIITKAAKGSQRIAFYHRTAADCLGKFHGQAERTLRLLFESAASNAPSVIFIDEVDGLLPARSTQQEHLHSSVVTTMLALMDGLNDRGNVVVIGATNRPEAIDAGLRRPGRFDREIYCPLPSMSDRAAILQLHTSSWNQKPDKRIINAVAGATEGYAGADLKALCSSVAMRALKREYPNLMKVLVNEQTLLCLLDREAPSAQEGNEEADTDFDPDSEKQNDECTNKTTVAVDQVGEKKEPNVTDDARTPDVQTNEELVGRGGVGTITEQNELPNCDHGEEDQRPRETDHAENADQAEAAAIPGGDRQRQTLSDLKIFQKLNVLPEDWRIGMSELPPPCSRRATTAATASASDITSPIASEIAPVLIPSLRSVFQQLSEEDIPDEFRRFKQIFGQEGQDEADIEHLLVAEGLVHPCPVATTRGRDAGQREAKIPGNERFPSRFPQCKRYKSRILIAGEQGNGQKQLAGCLLSLLHSERTLTMSLPSLLVDGAGDIYTGVIHAMKHMNVGGRSPLTIYLPHVELWSIEYDEKEDECQSTRAWEVFMQQYDHISSHRALCVIATSQTATDEMPPTVKTFFGCGNTAVSAESSTERKSHRIGTAAVDLRSPTLEERDVILQRSASTGLYRALICWLDLKQKSDRSGLQAIYESESAAAGPKDWEGGREGKDCHNNSRRGKKGLNLSESMLQHVTVSLKTLGHKLLRDTRVCTCEDHIMITEMDSSRTLHAVAQKAVSGEFGSRLWEMSSLLERAAQTHQTTAAKWSRRNPEEAFEALLISDSAKAAADEYLGRLFALQKLVFTEHKSRENKREGATVAATMEMPTSPEILQHIDAVKSAAEHDKSQAEQINRGRLDISVRDSNSFKKAAAEVLNSLTRKAECESPAPPQPLSRILAMAATLERSLCLLAERYLDFESIHDVLDSLSAEVKKKTKQTVS